MQGMCLPAHILRSEVLKAKRIKAGRLGVLADFIGFAVR
jgi:hypothetical protein